MPAKCSNVSDTNEIELTQFSDEQLLSHAAGEVFLLGYFCGFPIETPPAMGLRKSYEKEMGTTFVMPILHYFGCEIRSTTNLRLVG